MKYCIVIPSLRRPEVLHDTVLSVLAQDILPVKIILAVTSESDVLASTRDFPLCNILIGPPGLTLQLNAAVDSLPDDVDMVTILDDDVELATDYCKNALKIMSNRHTVVLFDGSVVKNGKVTRQEAIEILSVCQHRDDFTLASESYGCNMNVRRSLFKKIRFDISLVGAALMHDLEFARQAQKIGDVGHSEACKLVHLMVQISRPEGLRFGYSQVANPIYFYRKGLIGTSELMSRHLVRGLAANTVGAFVDLVKPGEIDRKGRLRGNLIALRRLMSGDCRPEYVAKIS